MKEQDDLPVTPSPAADFPPLHRQAWNLARSLATFVADGCQTVSRDEYQTRLAICDRCDQRRSNRCLACGCRLALKARGRAFQCPLGRWLRSCAVFGQSGLTGKTKRARLLRLDQIMVASDGHCVTSRERNLAMVIMQDALPGIKRFLKAANFSATTERHVTGFIVAFIMHLGRMSAASAGGAIRLHPRHRAQAMRFLGRDCRTRDLAVLMQLAGLLLAFEHRRTGRWLLIVDQTYCTQQGIKTENTFNHGQRAKSGKDRRRRKQEPRRRCHCFVMALLITPSGLRLRDNRIDRNSIQMLPRLANLRYLQLCGTNVCDEDLAYVWQLPLLRELVLDNTSVGDNGLAYLAKMQSLERLYLQGTRISDRGLLRLKSLRGLEVLRLGGTSISDEGTLALREITNLREVELSRTGVTDCGIRNLGGLPHLRCLGLCNTAVTQGCLSDLRRRRVSLLRSALAQ